jgi:integrin beta 2
MFIVNYGHIKQIQKLCMNGKHHQVVIETELGMPIGLTLDIPANRLYWIDQEFGKVESANLDGSDRYISSI